MAFTLLFLAALALSVLLRLWLANRQRRHVAAAMDAVPAPFDERITLFSHQRAARYTMDRTRLSMVETVVEAGVLLCLTVLGGIEAIAQFTRGLPVAPLLQQLLLMGSVLLILGLTGLPFTLWRQFRLEARYGFNRMTLRLFITDTLKATLVGLVLGTPLLALVLWLMAEAGQYWWLWAWAVWCVFNLAIVWLFPTVIAPLFNTFKPLEDATLAERVHALAERCGFALGGLFVMDGSKRSAHGNAYFTGFGRSRRIVFFDTLLARLNADEIEAVLAHELGHFHHRHIVRRIITSFAVALGFLALLGWLANQAWFYTGLGVQPLAEGGNQAVALLLFLLVTPVFTFLLTPITSVMSRRDEYQADAYAARQSAPQHLVSALVKLYDDNAATLTPDPWHSAFYDSHPPAALRIGRLQTMTA